MRERARGMSWCHNWNATYTFLQCGHLANVRSVNSVHWNQKKRHSASVSSSNDQLWWWQTSEHPIHVVFEWIKIRRAIYCFSLYRTGWKTNKQTKRSSVAVQKIEKMSKHISEGFGQSASLQLNWIANELMNEWVYTDAFGIAFGFFFLNWWPDQR